MQFGTRPFTESEIGSMLITLKRPRDKCLFVLGLRTGFRISELLSMKVSDVIQYNVVKSSVTVSKSNTKGKVASRTIPLSTDLRGVLEAYIKELPKEQMYLFQSERGNKLSRIQAWRVITDAADVLKLEGKIATHSLRKTYSQRMYEKLGKDIAKLQRAMGHASVNSTISYISFTDTEIDDAILSL